MKSLNDFLEETIICEEFTVDDQEKANWALRKLRSLQEKKLANEELANKEKAKIDAWLNEVNSQLDQDIEYFQGLLTAYAIRLRQEDPKFKSIKLPNGKFGFRKQQPKWQYDDRKLLEYLKLNNLNELIRTKEEVDKSKLKKLVQIVNGQAIDPEAGEVIDRITIVEDKFKIDL
jgi:phage host-nuclease inhibitor protein Gam